MYQKNFSYIEEFHIITTVQTHCNFKNKKQRT